MDYNMVNAFVEVVFAAIVVVTAVITVVLLV